MGPANSPLERPLANATYVFACWLAYEAGTAGSSDFKWEWFPSGATMVYIVPHVNARRQHPAQPLLHRHQKRHRRIRRVRLR
jgi:hypothetical protein